MVYKSEIAINITFCLRLRKSVPTSPSIMYKSTAPLCMFLLVNSVVSVQLPSSYQKCNRREADFNECLKTAVNEAIHQLTKPFPEVGLPSIEPFLTTLESTPAGTTTFLFEQKYKNFTLHGLTTGEVLSFEINFETKTVNLEIAYEKLWSSFTYEFSGKLFLFEVSGTNPGTITAKNLNLKITFDLEEYEKDGKQHYKVVGNDVVMREPQGIVFNFTDLLRSDLPEKNLGGGLLSNVAEIVDPNIMINENFIDVFYDIKRGYEVIWAKDFGGLFNNLLEHVSVSELFGDSSVNNVL